MCAAQLKIQNKFARKEFEVWASDEELIEPIRPLVCNGKHEHIPLEGTCHGVPKTRLAQVWPWEFASRVATGVASVVRRYYENLNKEHYPTEEGTIPPPAERSRSNRFHWPCPACRTNMAKDHPRHTRHPEDCRWPFEEPTDWGCVGCKHHQPRAHSSHTLTVGECRWASADYRATSRRGHHPRDPRIPASSDPTSSLRAQPQEDLQEVGEPNAEEEANKSRTEEQVKDKRAEDENQPKQNAPNDAAGAEAPYRKETRSASSGDPQGSVRSHDRGSL